MKKNIFKTVLGIIAISPLSLIVLWAIVDFIKAITTETLVSVIVITFYLVIGVLFYYGLNLLFGKQGE